MDSSSVHHRELFTVHTAMVYVIQVCWQLVSRIKCSCSQAVSSQFEKLVHLVGFIIRSSPSEVGPSIFSLGVVCFSSVFGLYRSPPCFCIASMQYIQHNSEHTFQLHSFHVLRTHYNHCCYCACFYCPVTNLTSFFVYALGVLVILLLLSVKTGVSDNRPTPM